MFRVFSFEELPHADLIVDAVYEGGPAPNASSDPIARLLPGSGNSGGFRAAGRGPVKQFVALYSSGEEGDWPDVLDLATGQFVYFGDNRKPGHDLHDTSRGGNELLRTAFQDLHGDHASRQRVPPFLVFTKHPTATSSRSVRFRGLAVPGFPGLPMTEDLVAVWKITNGQRFQNYRAVFTLLDIARLSREWLRSLFEDRTTASSPGPSAWVAWLGTGGYRPLTAEPTRVIRSEAEQRPASQLMINILGAVWKHFEHTPIAFESFAARVYQMSDRRVIIDEVTRATVDGGRDAIGRYLIGLSVDPVYAEFALEAKCYRPAISGLAANTVGVREVARLISRIRNRQFGVLVTTSIIARQAYEEVRDDRHPIVFLCGRDIAEILINAGYGSVERVRELLGNSSTR